MVDKVYRTAELEVIKAERGLPGTYKSLSEAYDAMKRNERPAIIILEMDGVEEFRLVQDERKRDRWIKTSKSGKEEVVHVSRDGMRRIAREP